MQLGLCWSILRAQPSWHSGVRAQVGHVPTGLHTSLHFHNTIQGTGQISGAEPPATDSLHLVGNFSASMLLTQTRRYCKMSKHEGWEFGRLTPATIKVPKPHRTGTSSPVVFAPRSSRPWEVNNSLVSSMQKHGICLRLGATDRPGRAHGDTQRLGFVSFISCLAQAGDHDAVPCCI